MICRPDKGRGVVLLNKTDYVSKMCDILQDDTKFSKLVFDDIYKLKTKVADKVTRFINNLKSLGAVNEKKASHLKPTGSNPAVMYGFPKVHKLSHGWMDFV